MKDAREEPESSNRVSPLAPPTGQRLVPVPTLEPTLIPPITNEGQPDTTQLVPGPDVPPTITSSAQTAPGVQVPGYEILEELGRGGMGVVYRARQVELNRVVALKMILSGLYAGAQELIRFRAEAQAIARLRHPHIIQVHEVGEADVGGNVRVPFFSLEFCPGGSLDRKLAGTPLSPREAASLVEKLARAMQLAHEYQVLHRDLKPANVLLAEDGEPRITDFGLAKRLDEVGPTRSEALLGTPGYMAPEQAAGKIKELGPAADIYALGAILYECLTGRAPFKAATVMETLQQAQTDDPVPPSQLQKKVHRDLETICLKCLRKDPAQRYASAAELAEDLRRFQAFESIRARPVSRVERVAKWTRRRPAAAALIAVSVLAVVALLGGAAYFTDQLRAQRNEALGLADRAKAGEIEAIKAKKRALEGEASALREKEIAEKERRVADQERSRARSQLDRARRNLFTAQLIRAGAVLEREPDEALKLLHDYDACPIDLRDFTWGLYARRAQRDRLTLEGHLGPVHAIALSPDGKTLASAGADKTIKLWDLATGKEPRTLLGHKREVLALAFSPDGKTLASGGEDRTVRLWDLASDREPISLPESRGEIRVLAFSPDSKTLAYGGGWRVFKLWDVSGRKEQATLDGGARIGSLAFSPDGKTLASASGVNDKIVSLWDLSTYKLHAKLKGHTSSVSSVVFSPDGKVLASSGYREIKLWNVATNKELDTFRPGDVVKSLSFSADGKSLAGAEGSAIRVWDLARREALVLRGHRSSVASVCFRGDSRWLASGSDDGTARLWDLSPNQECLALSGHPGPVTDAAFSPDGKLLASAAADRTVRLWDMAKGQVRFTLQGHTGQVNCVRFGPDGQWLISGGAEEQFGASGSQGAVRLWWVKDGKERALLGEHKLPVTAVAIHPDGKTAVSASADGAVKLWNVTDERELLLLQGHRGPVLAVCFSPDGKTLASAGKDGIVKLWGPSTGKERMALKGHTGQVNALAFRPDGKELASGSADGTIRLWDLSTGQARVTLVRAGNVTSVAFSPDGATLVSGDGGAIKLWEVVTGQLRATLPGHGEGPSHVAFHPAGKLMASVGADRLVKLWDADPGPWRATWVMEPPDPLDHFRMQRITNRGGLCFSPDGKRLAWGGGTRNQKQNPFRFEDGWVTVLDVHTGQSQAALRDRPGLITAVAFSSDSQRLALGSSDHTLTLWDPATNNQVTRTGHRSWVKAVAFSPDGKTVATTGLDYTVKLWDSTGRQRVTLGRHGAEVLSLCFSPDGKLLASAGNDRIVKLWDLVSKCEPAILSGHVFPINTVAFSPDGKRLASGGGESEKPGELKLWDVASRREVASLPGHTGPVQSVAFSPDGKTLAAGSSGRSSWGPGELKLWDVATAREVASYRGHKTAVCAVAFTPDGKTLASAEDHAAINLWDVPPRPRLLPPTFKQAEKPAEAVTGGPGSKTPGGERPLLDPGTLTGFSSQPGKTFRFQITGQTTGEIYGTDIYTDDSILAAAAVHAGILKAGQKGIVRVTILEGKAAYKGSTRNGVTSSEYGSWNGSYKVEAGDR
jgi:WD40 repeat protein